MEEKPAIIICGAGPIGLTAAIELTLLGYPVRVYEKKIGVSGEGSRAICYAKRTLEIWHRIGCAMPMVKKGVTWNKGRVHYKNQELYSFDLLPLKNGLFPAFINLQQNLCEEYLLERLNQLNPNILQSGSEVTKVQNKKNSVEIEINKTDGSQETIQASLLLACDGARSFVQQALNLKYEGEVFKDRFLICDIKMKTDSPPERFFWFDPDFHNGNSALLHKQADDVWRLDLQLSWRANPEYEKRQEVVRPRIQKILKHDEFDIVWVSVYTFQCRTLGKYDYQRIFFAGDSAHQVSPFGARGANSGVQDIDNLVWKIDSYLKGKVSLKWLGNSYSDERRFAADENIKNSTYTTNFMIANTSLEYAFRTATLVLSKENNFARDFVNSGRLSVPAVLYNSKLNLPSNNEYNDADKLLGSAMLDVELQACNKQNNDKYYLLELLKQRCFYALIFSNQNLNFDTIEYQGFQCKSLVIAQQSKSQNTASGFIDATNALHDFYQLKNNEVFILRPDHHIMARYQLDNLKGESREESIIEKNTLEQIFAQCINHILKAY